MELDNVDGLDDIIDEIKKTKHNRKSSQEILKSAFEKQKVLPARNLNKSMIRNDKTPALAKDKPNLNKSMIDNRNKRPNTCKLGNSLDEKSKITSEYDKILDELALVFGDNLEHFDEDSNHLISSGASHSGIQH